MNGASCGRRLWYRWMKLTRWMFRSGELLPSKTSLSMTISPLTSSCPMVCSDSLRHRIRQRSSWSYQESITLAKHQDSDAYTCGRSVLYVLRC